jgi:hypothetical protein
MSGNEVHRRGTEGAEDRRVPKLTVSPGERGILFILGASAAGFAAAVTLGPMRGEARTLAWAVALAGITLLFSETRRLISRSLPARGRARWLFASGLAVAALVCDAGSLAAPDGVEWAPKACILLGLFTTADLADQELYRPALGLALVCAVEVWIALVAAPAAASGAGTCRRDRGSQRPLCAPPRSPRLCGELSPLAETPPACRTRLLRCAA